MCKVMAFSNFSKFKSMENAVNNALVQVTHEETDGYGYAIQTKSGVFGERGLNTENCQFNMNKTDLNLPFIQKNTERFGQLDKVIGAAIFHGRTSTNQVNLINTHPINKNGWSLIHNGVVTNHGPKYKMVTSNDTEHLVHYLSEKGIHELAKNLTGYYAVCAIDPKGQLHVFGTLLRLFLWGTLKATKHTSLRQVKT